MFLPLKKLMLLKCAKISKILQNAQLLNNQIYFITVHTILKRSYQITDFFVFIDYISTVTRFIVVEDL